MKQLQMPVKEFVEFLKNTNPSQYKSLIPSESTTSYIPLIDAFLSEYVDTLKRDKELFERFFSFLSSLLLIDSLNKQIEISATQKPPIPLLNAKITKKIYELRNYYVHHRFLYQ